MGIFDAMEGLVGATEDERRMYEKALADEKLKGALALAEKETEIRQALDKAEQQKRNELAKKDKEIADEKKSAEDANAKCFSETMRIEKERLVAETKMLNDHHKETLQMHKNTEADKKTLEENHRGDMQNQREEYETRIEDVMKRETTRFENAQTKADAEIKAAQTKTEEERNKLEDSMAKLTTEFKKETDDLRKEALANMKQQEAVHTERMDKNTTEFKAELKKAADDARQREDILELARKAVDEQYRNDMEKAQNSSKEVQDKIKNEYNATIKEKDSELSNIRKENIARTEKLHNEHLADLVKGQNDYRQLQDVLRAEVERLQMEKQEVILKCSTKVEGALQNTIEYMGKYHDQARIDNDRIMYNGAVGLKKDIEVSQLWKCKEELAPVKGLKIALIRDAEEACNLWMDLFASDEADALTIKDSIMAKLREMKQNINNIFITIDASRSLGEQQKEWKEILNQLLTGTSKYVSSVMKTIKKEETTQPELETLADKCDELRETIMNLPNMDAESIESLFVRYAQQTITSIPNPKERMALGASEGDANGQLGIEDQ